jgi:RNA-directed DNA polymerase
MRWAEINTVEELAAWLDIPVDELWAHAASADDGYKPPIAKRKQSGGTRRIDPPRQTLKSIQRSILKLIAPRISSAIAYGVKESSHIDAAFQHVRKHSVGKLDITNCYECIRASLVRRSVRNAGFGGDALRLLVALLTRNGRLRQGPPSSPAVAHLVLAEIDRQICEEMLRLGVVVTRVADDYAISGSNRSSVCQMMRFIESRLGSIGLRVNPAKTSIMGRHEPQIIYGYIVNNSVAIPKNKKSAGRRLSKKGLRDSVRRVRRFGCSNKQWKRLLGQINHVRQTDPTAAQRLHKALIGGTR